MAWHLHTVRQKLILAALVRRHVYTSVELCCLSRNTLIPSYHCCLHRYQGATCLFHQVHQLHTTHCLINHGVPQHSKQSCNPQWPWEVNTEQSSNKESISQVCNDECQAWQEFQSLYRGRSLPWDQRETRLMCVSPSSLMVNQKDSVHIEQDGSCETDDMKQDSCSTSSEQTENQNEIDPPLVFHVDSKGRQKMIDLLAEHKQSSGHSALNELNKLADIIQKETLSIRQNSKQHQDSSTANMIHETPSTHCVKVTGDVYQDYLKTVKQTSVHDEERKSRLMSMRAVTRHKELQMVLCSSSASDDHLKLSSDTSTPSPDGGKGPPSKEQLAVMYHRLFEQIPNFYSQSHDYTMYSNNIVFDNRILNVKTKGMPAYKATIQSLKYLSTACLWNVNLEVLNLIVNPEMNCVQARWRVTGVPLHRLILFPWSKGAKKYFDAFSTFEVGSDGLIHTHIVDKVMPIPGDKMPSLATRLGLALGIIRPPPAVQGNCTSPVTLPFLKPKWLFKKIAE